MDRKKQLMASYMERPIKGGVYRIINQVTGKYYLKGEVNLDGSKNRFDFSKQTGSCVVLKLQHEWKEYGPENFLFEIVEEIEKKADQSQQDFKEEIKLLESLWREKFDPSLEY